MSLLTVFVVLVVAGIALYLVNRFVPMDGKIKNILNWVVVIIIIIWLLNSFGLLNWLKSVHV